MGCVSLQIMQQTCEKQDQGMRWKLEKGRHTIERHLSDAGTKSEIIRRQQATKTSRRARFFKILHDGERLRQLAAIDEQSGDLGGGVSEVEGEGSEFQRRRDVFRTSF